MSRTSPVARREIFGWAMFDFANSSYTTIIVTVAFSVYFKKLVVGGDRGVWLWGLAILISNTLVLVTAPIVGAIADGSGRKKPFLAVTWMGCVLGTAGLYLAAPGMPALAVGLFVISNVSYAMGETLVAAFLPEISTPDNVGRISGFGWGLGYFGGLGSLLLVRPLLAGGFELHNLANLRLVWPLTGLFFLLAALPTFLFLRERAPRPPRFELLRFTREGFARLGRTFHSLGHFRDLTRFFGVFFVYSCGLMTVITMAGIYAEETLGFTASDLVVMFLVLQLASVAGALIGGPLQDRFGSRLTLQAILVLWTGVALGAALAPSKAFFWGVSLAAGLGIGSLQAASRGLVGLFSPVEKSGEFFGFWGLAMRAAYAVGPFLFGTLVALSGSQRLAVGATAVTFVLGWLGLRWVDQDAGRAAAAAWSARAEAS